MADIETLFRPLTVKTMELKNRIVMAPMTRFFAPDGMPGMPQVEYYRARALGKVGLILSEGTVVDRPAARNDRNIPFFHGQALDGWKQVIDAVHAAGGRMAPQIWHVGSMENPQTDWLPDAPVESPSGMAAPDTPRGEAMSEADIADTIDAFGKAAADAKRLGFDAVEIHGAHGYLIDQFFWAETNHRADRYGGATIAERARFAAEIVSAVRQAVGADFPILMRISQWKQQLYTARLAETPDEMSAWLLPLVEAGVDILDCSQRVFSNAEFPEIDGPEGLNFAGWAKKLTGAVTISVGSVGLSCDFLSAFEGATATSVSLEALLGRMERGEFDLIALGRTLLANPSWPEIIRAGDYQKVKQFEVGDLAILR